MRWDGTARLRARVRKVVERCDEEIANSTDMATSWSEDAEISRAYTARAAVADYIRTELLKALS